MSNTNGFNVTSILDRKPGVIAAAPTQHTPSRLAAAADALSLLGHAKARAELLNEALMAAVQLFYAREPDGSMPHLDRDGRTLRPVPWGSAGHKQWTLRRTEADVLRLLLMDRLQPVEGRALPLFVWSAEARNWFVNLADYPTEAGALAYVAQHPVTAKLWQRYAERVRKAGRK